jgi:hypothetical protein
VVAKILISEMDGTPKQICFGDHAGDFSPTAANDLRKTTDGTQETDAQMAVASLANGSYIQTAKVDLGANWAREYEVRAAMEFAATPTAGNACLMWWAPSQSSTAATANPGNVSGSAASYAGYSSNAAASVKHLGNPIGRFITTAQATTTVQVAVCGRFRPAHRYGSLVFYNGSGAAIHSDDVECHIVLDPIVDESQ